MVHCPAREPAPRVIKCCHKAATWSNRTGLNDDRERRQDTAVNQVVGNKRDANRVNVNVRFKVRSS